MALIPNKYNIAFGLTMLNQGGALVHIYTDGSVLVTVGGVEMGQGLFTKCYQVGGRSPTRPLALPVSATMWYSPVIGFTGRDVLCALTVHDG